MANFSPDDYQGHHSFKSVIYILRATIVRQYKQLYLLRHNNKHNNANSKEQTG